MATKTNSLTTGQLARRAGVHANTIIRYEERGVIKSERVGPLRIRLFSPDAVEKVRRARRATSK